MKYVGLLLFALVCFFIWPRNYRPFEPSLLAYDIVDESFSEFDCPGFDEIVSQPLTYLGHGRQAIAFSSGDGKYVLKFFLFKRFHDQSRSFSSIRNLFPGHRKMKDERHYASREKYIRNALKNYDTVFRSLKEETGLVAVHLKAQMLNLPTCQIIDLYGKIHTIDLNRASFIVQKKAQERDWSAEDILAVRNLAKERALKGFTDHKGHLSRRHFAFLDNKPIMIDPGNLVFRPEILADPTSELERLDHCRL